MHIEKNDPIVNVNNVRLKYPVKPLMRRSIKNIFLSPFGVTDDPVPEFYEALRGISFQIYEGERVGIIGKNGSGKSTILRAIAGIYPIESGDIHVSGKIRGLYDLTSGFELEDTGRANIYLRGYLLGSSRAEISAMEEDIIDFSGLKDFIDLPLKTYSVGMQVRLAFAISTAIAGDVLLIDEILAAGDAEFFSKAQQRMRTLIQNAQCVILVSHDLSAIKQLCSRVLWIDNGLVRMEGPTDEVIDAYLAYLTTDDS